MKAVTRSTFVGLFVYAGLSLTGWLAIAGRLSMAYGVLFTVCIIAVYFGNCSDDNEVDEK